MSFKPMYKLLDWVPEDKLDFKILCTRPDALRIIEKSQKKKCYLSLFSNPSAISMIEKKIKEPYFENNPKYKIYWMFLSSNENAVHILQKNLDKVNWQMICYNENAYETIVKKNLDKIN